MTCWDPCHDHDHHHPRKLTHVHEVLGSVEIAEKNTDPHNHRFATVSDEVIPMGNTHVHEIKFRTDFYEDHFHEFKGRTGPAIMVGDRHVHFLESVTEEADCHVHKFRVGTLINDPIGD
ncbi:YmaF family protein [Clostridium sp. Marseille-P299]|uniref:YmaF family protein n=1 Tax=Clostridium sp. Marseille-P299 TaxID=1805477 RepID=UPI0008295E2E|nr:YmaF family protein [Clostridium sp. Marseille-P299]